MRIRHISILFILLIFLVSCNNEVNSKEHLGEIYSVALGSIMEKDEALSRTKGLDGVLLRIDKVDFVSNDFIFDGSKYRAGDGAIGVKAIVHFENSNWQIKDSKVTWKS